MAGSPLKISSAASSVLLFDESMSFRTINFGEVPGDKSNQSHVAGHTIPTLSS